MSSLRRGHANLLCIVPILTDDLFRGSTRFGLWFHLSLSSVAKKVLWEHQFPPSQTSPRKKKMTSTHGVRCKKIWNGVLQKINKKETHNKFCGCRQKKCSLRGSNSQPWNYETHALLAAPQERCTESYPEKSSLRNFGSTGKNASHCGTRTPDFKFKSRDLYQLS